MAALLTRLEKRAADAYTAVAMPRMPSRDHGAQWTMTVTAVTQVAPAVRRITFAAPGFRGYEVNGPDEYFGLLMPRGGHLVMPDAAEVNLRRAVHALPEAQRPDLRWYTLRAVRPDAGEADVDIVLHGDAGPGSAWASRAQVGQVAGFRQHTALHLAPAGGRQLLLADETGAPALAAVLQAHPDCPVTAFVETPDRDHLCPLPEQVQVVEREGRAPGAALLETIRRAELDPPRYTWICGENALATGLRRHLVKERGVERRTIMFSSFWKVGEARI